MIMNVGFVWLQYRQCKLDYCGSVFVMDMHCFERSLYLMLR